MITPTPSTKDLCDCYAKDEHDIVFCNLHKNARELLSFIKRVYEICDKRGSFEFDISHSKEDIENLISKADQS